MFKAFCDHSIPLPCGDAIDLSAQLDTFGDAIHGNDAFCTVVQCGSNSGCCAKNVDDHYDGVVQIVQVRFMEAAQVRILKADILVTGVGYSI